VGALRGDGLIGIGLCAIMRFLGFIVIEGPSLRINRGFVIVTGVASCC
jgi:hypothetical protein